MKKQFLIVSVALLSIGCGSSVSEKRPSEEQRITDSFSIANSEKDWTAKKTDTIKIKLDADQSCYHYRREIPMPALKKNK